MPHELGTEESLTLCFTYLIYREKEFPAHFSPGDENVTPYNIHEEPKTFHTPEIFHNECLSELLVLCNQLSFFIFETDILYIHLYPIELYISYLFSSLSNV